MSVSVIVVAAGAGKRMGSKLPKALIPLAGRPLVSWCLDVFDGMREVDEIILVGRRGRLKSFQREILDRFPFRKVSALVAGGRERWHSVSNAIGRIEDGDGYVLVHDGARPLVSADVVHNAIDGARRVGASVAAVPLKFTVKEGRGKRVVRTIERERLWEIQTPQAFRLSLLKKAYARADLDKGPFTDDAVMVEAMGAPVALTEGDYENLKITTPEDLLLAEILLKRRKTKIGRR